MYTSIEGFINGGNNFESLATYDFKNEAPWEEVRNEKSAIIKFQKYINFNKSNQKFDCDNCNGTCKFIDNIFNELWGWNYKNRYEIPDILNDKFGAHWPRMGSDTMNSFSTTYKQTLRILPKDYDAVDNNEYLQKFAALTHSIGNFTLVPFKLDESRDLKSFNQYRGFKSDKYFVYDYFDLSLKLIKENINDDTFKMYIDTFFLNDYVDESYRIKPLFKSHGEFLTKERLPLENPVKFLPQNEDELNEYLLNVIKNIESRGNRMVKELKNNIIHKY